MTTLASRNLATLLAALEGVALDPAEQGTVAWLSGQERPTVERLAAIITRARTVPLPAPRPPETTATPSDHRQARATVLTGRSSTTRRAANT